MNDSVVLACRQLKKSYHEGPKPVEVLKNINLNIKAGDRVAIIGSSGSCLLYTSPSPRDA